MKSVEITEEMKLWNIEGTFIREGKFRFHCYVDVEGIETLCYMPVNFKLENVFSLEKRKVVLKKYVGLSNKYEYILEAVKINDGLILLNLQFLNRIIEKEICRDFFDYLGKRKSLIREFTIENYKSDLFIVDSNTFIEIKSVLSWEKIVCYPINTSKHCVEQLEKIERLLGKKIHFNYLFFSMSSNVNKIVIDADSLYGIMLKRCIDKGLILRAYALGGKMGIEIKKEIEIVIQ